MLTKSSLLPLVVMEPSRRRMREHAILGHKGSGGDLHHHESGLKAGMIGEKGGEFLVERWVHEPVHAALGDPGERRQRNGHEIQLECERLPVEVAAGDDLVAED